MIETLPQLNSASSSDAESALSACCGAKEWTDRMVAARPFEDLSHLLQSADQIWWSLEDDDWLEAFRCHPRIGESKAAQSSSAVAHNWSAQEQSGVSTAAQATTELLTDLNRQYEERFGYIFIVCASGKSAEEMLSILKDRLGNDEQKELRIAAAEQAKITKLRLEKLLTQ